MGYAYAMLHRLVGYRVFKFQLMVILYIFSIAIKFSIIHNSDTVLTIIVIFLDVLTVILSYKSETLERKDV